MLVVNPAIGVFVTALTRPLESVLNTGIDDDDPYVAPIPTFVKDKTPPPVRVASPDKPCVCQDNPLPISKLPEVGVVVPKRAPLILFTRVVVCPPDISPDKAPVKLIAEAILPVILIL